MGVYTDYENNDFIRSIYVVNICLETHGFVFIMYLSSSSSNTVSSAVTYSVALAISLSRPLASIIGAVLLQLRPMNLLYVEVQWSPSFLQLHNILLHPSGLHPTCYTVYHVDE